MPKQVLKILTSVVCILAVFAALAGSSSGMENGTDHQHRTKRRVSPLTHIITSPLVESLTIFLKLLGDNNADSVEFVISALTGTATLSTKAKEDFNNAIHQELSVIRRDLNNLRTLFQDQAMKSDYGRAEEDISAPMSALEAYQQVPSTNLLHDFLEAAKPMQKSVKHLFGGLLGRNKVNEDIIDTLIKVQFCRTRKVEETVGEFVTLIKAGIAVEGLEKQMKNFTRNERKPFHDYVTNAAEELDKRLEGELKRCRQLKDVKPQMRRILDDHAGDEDPKNVLHQVFSYLSDRYDHHDWFLISYDARNQKSLGHDDHLIEYHFAFYEAETSIGTNQLKIAALPVARRQLHDGNNNHQARHFLIDSFCPRNHSMRRVYSNYRGKTHLLKSNGFYYASFPMTGVLWTHSPGMDLAHWPYHNGPCQLGNHGRYLFAIAPPYKIPTDHIPTNRSMALVSTYHRGALTASSSPDSSSLTFAPYTGHPGQRWKFVGAQLQNDLGLCASTCGSNGSRVSIEQEPCDDENHVWHLSSDHVLFYTCAAFNEWHSETGVLFFKWFFTEDGKEPYQPTSLSDTSAPITVQTANGRPLIHARSGLVLSVQHNDPTSRILTLDKDRDWAGQRWRLEGHQLKNDWDNCLRMTKKEGKEMELEQVPCQSETAFTGAMMWSFQDGFIFNGWDVIDHQKFCFTSDDTHPAGKKLVPQQCPDSPSESEWVMEDYMGPLPSRPGVAQGPPASRALVNGFGLALSVKDNVKGWQWLIQETYKGLSGQRWFLHEGRLHNDLGNCLYSDERGWALQNKCHSKIYAEESDVFLSNFWYHSEWNQLKNRFGCLGVSKNVNKERAWLVVEKCDTSKWGQIWTYWF